MVALPNIYSSDIKALLDWWKEVKDIESVYQENIWNLMERLEKDLHDIQRGHVKGLN